MIYGSTGCKNNSREIGDINFSLAEFFGRKALDLDKRTKNDLDSELLSNVDEGLGWDTKIFLTFTLEVFL